MFLVTREFLQMARKASTLVVRGVDRSTDPDTHGTVGSMELIFREAKFGSAETGRLTYLDIPSYVQNSVGERTAKCVTSIDFYWSLGNHNTLASVFSAVLKPGDALEFEWYRGAFETEGLKSVNYTGDALNLIVRRGIDKPNPKTLRFLIDSRICESLSSARIIQSR